MLWLKRITTFNEVKRCKVTEEYIQYGDFYYEDDEDGMVIKATVYRDLRDQYREDTFDDSRLRKAESQRDYEDALRPMQQDFWARDVVKRKIATKEVQ